MATTRLQTDLTARDLTKSAFRSLNRSLAFTERAVMNVAKVTTGLGLVFGGLAVRQVVAVNRAFDSLEASLVTSVGSIEKAGKAFAFLQDFAKRTPFSLQEVVGSFNVLVSQGLRPTTAQLNAFADIAGGTSKSIMQFAEAVADGSRGEFERLKEFGILASKEGNKVTLSMGDLTLKVNRNSEEILKALAEIGKAKFAGGAERQAQTLGGAFTNLGDNVDSFMRKVGKAGLNKELSGLAKAISRIVDGNNDLAKSFSNVLVKAIRITVKFLKMMVDNIEVVYKALLLAFGVVVLQKIAAVARALGTLGKVVFSLGKIFGVLKGKIGLIAVVIGAMAGGVAIATGNLDSFIDKIKDTIDEGSRLFNKIIGGNNIFGDFVKTTDSAEKTLDKLAKAHKGTAEQVARHVDKIEDAYDSQVKSTKARVEEIKKLLNYEDVIGDTNEKIKLATELKQKDASTTNFSNRIIREATDAQIDYAAANERTYGAGAIKGVKDYYRSISDNAKNATQFTTKAFQELEGSLSEFFQSGKLNFRTFTDAIKKGLADLAAKAVVSTGINFLGKVFPTLKFAEGGLVPGTGGPKSDNILARISSGEYVIKAASVDKFGKGFFDQVNAGIMPQTGMDMRVSKGLAESTTPAFGFGSFFKKIFKGIKSAFDTVVDAVSKVVKYVSQAVKNMVDGILSGDLATIASLAASFILPGVGTAITSGFATATGFSGYVSAITSGISQSFAQGILGSASLSTIATSVGTELAKGALVDTLSDKISTKVLGVTDGMAASGSSFDNQRSESFGKLFNRAAPYLARGTGGPVSKGDNVKVGESGPEMFIPNRNGTIAPIKSDGAELVNAVNLMKDEIVSLRRQMGRLLAGQELAGARV